MSQDNAADSPATGTHDGIGRSTSSRLRRHPGDSPVSPLDIQRVTALEREHLLLSLREAWNSMDSDERQHVTEIVDDLVGRVAFAKITSRNFHSRTGARSRPAVAVESQPAEAATPKQLAVAALPMPC